MDFRASAKREKTTTHGSWTDRKKLIIILVLCAFAAMVGVGFRLAYAARSVSPSPGQEVESTLSDQNKETADLDNGGTLSLPDSDRTSSSTQQNSTGDDLQEVEDTVSRIRAQYDSDAASALAGNGLTITQEDGSTLYFKDGDTLCLAVFPAGTRSAEYQCTFYFDRGQLLFACYEGAYTHQFYFDGGALLRWISLDEPTGKSQVHDLENSDQFKAWERTVSEAAAEVLEWKPEVPETISMSDIAQISATSYLTEKTTAHTPDRIADGSLSTAWVEGAEGQGLGESVSLQFTGTYLVTGLRIYAGYQKSEDLYYKNSRPQSIMVTFSDGTQETFSLEDQMGEQQLTLTQPRATESVTITIEAVYPGSRYQDTVISDLSLF